MPPKTLKWWLERWHTACVLACHYGSTLTVTQFCASHGMEDIEREQVLAYFGRQGVED